MKKLIVLAVIFFTFFTAEATHLMGGEITWECIKDPANPDVGKYIFTMKLYRDCNGTTLPTTSMNLSVWYGFSGPHPTTPTITCNWVSSTDISPACNSAQSGWPALDCATNPIGAVEEYVYQSAPITLSGTPPTDGWHFTWDSCCRNGAIVNLVDPDTKGFTLRAAMYPYTDPNTGLVLPADPCFDSSPLFNESPKTIICAGYPFAYSHNASDPELDSIRYYWAEPYDDFVGTYDPVSNNPPALPFVPPYAFNSPIPGGVNMNPVSGEISYNSAISGNFATVVRVEAYKCGQLVSEIHRDIQAILISCNNLPGGGVNNPPTLTAPVGAQTWVVTLTPTGLPSYETTVTAGELITFDVIGEDLDLYNAVTAQYLTMEISGGQMAGDYVTDTDCANAPCATFVSPTGGIPPIIAPSIVSGVFEWQTSCYHVSSDIACGRTTNLYSFAVKVYDDFCPAPAIKIATILIYVVADNNMSFVNENPTCFGGDGTIVVTPSLSISQSAWDVELIDFSGNIINSSSGAIGGSGILQNIDEGSYIIRASGAGGCIVEDTVIFDAPFNPLHIESHVTHVSCYGGTDGQIGVLVENGLLPYTFYIDGVENMNPPPYDSIFTDLSEGVYIITVVDANSCSINDTVIIDAPDFPLQVFSSNTINVCDNNSTASALAYATGGTPFSDGSYIFEWFSDSWGSLGVGDSVGGLGVGSYYLEVTDSNGCDEFIAISVVAPQLPLNISPQLFAVPCKGDSTGSAIVYTGGGFAPYDYTWTTLSGTVLQTSLNIATHDTLANLPAGDYHLVVTDNNGCIEEITFNIVEPAIAMDIYDILVVDSISCYGDTVGRAWVYVSGGQPAYSYLWDNGDTDYLADSLTGGWHSVEVTDSWGCELDTSIYIPENSLIESELFIADSISCYGDNDGRIIVITQGGTPDSNGDYTYFWSNGVSGIGVDEISSLAYGSYYVTTRDDLGCVVTDSITITQPDPLYVIAQEILRARCFGESNGQAFAYGVGGTGPYNFSWTGTSQVGDTVNTLAAGLHTVILTDDRGCTATDTVMIHQPDALLLSITNTIYAYCIGVNTASISVSAQGGTTPYSYLWDDNLVTPQTTATATNLYAGIYTVVVTDDRGCYTSLTLDIDSVTSNMSVSITPLGPAGTTSISCYGANDGALIVSVDASSSSVPPHTYMWIGPGFTSTNDTITNLSAGLYSVTVTDANNCIVNQSQQITEPDQLTYTTYNVVNETYNSACDGQIWVYVQGGTGDYYYDVSEAGNFPIDSANQVQLINDSLIDNLCAGNYNIYITDDNNCEGSVVWGGSWQETIVFPGCTDSLASNYDPLAIIDDSSCIYIVFGCIDSTAFNYNISANTDDGSCCTLPTNLNQLFIDSNTTEFSWASSSTSFKLKYREDGVSAWQGPGVNIIHNTASPSQATTLPGVTYNWRVRDNNPGCPNWVNGTTFTTPIVGCTDSTAFNFNADAVFDDGSCDFQAIWGCIDSTMFNYNPIANSDDGSCICIGVTYFYTVPSTVNNCDGFAVANAVSSYSPITYNWVNSNGVQISNSNFATNLCNDVFIITITDNSGCSISDTLILGTIFGCTNSTMQNYNLFANTDDGSCIPFIYGCSDSSMYNYNSYANTDDGSCIPIVYGCIDSTMYNYSTLANTDDGSCILVVNGCTDNTMYNYNALANTDDGSCVSCNPINLSVSFIDSSSTELTWFSSGMGCKLKYRISGSTSNWSFSNPNINTISNTFSPTIITITSGVTYDWRIKNTVCNSDWIDGNSFTTPTTGCMDSTMYNYNSFATYDNGSCIPFIYGCLDNTMYNYNTLANTDDGSCIPIVYGCTDTMAYNYDSTSNTDNGNCLYCDLTITIYSSQNSSSASCDAWAFVDAYSSYLPISYQWSTNSTSNSVFNLCSGYYSVTITDDVGCTVSDSIYIGYNGCTEPLATNYDPNATVDDGSCIYDYSTCANPSPTGVYVTELIHDRARINWDNMNYTNCMVDQYRILYREVGTNSWSQKNMGTPLGSCTWPCNKTDKLILGLTAGTTYEYQMRAWYCGGGNSSWTALYNFTTLGACPNIGDLAVSSGSPTQATFTWDDSNGPYSFVRLKSRVDTIANPSGSDWFNIGGAGVVYPTFTKDKNNLTPGESYRAQARTWCNPSGGPYKSDTWTSLVNWTQPTSVRIEGGESITHLDVYPNPSRDIFNISFTSEQAQNLKVRILNVIGEELVSDELEQFMGEYTKQINLTNNAKGIYFLEIETEVGVINKKLILQ